MLHKPKLVLMDEATASIDLKTEKIIKECLDCKLSRCTMIIIAHRLQTVLGCQKIAVMKAGVIDAFGTPSQLCISEKDLS